MSISILGYERNSAFRITSGATISAGQLVGINSSGAAVLADADAATPIEAVGFALEDCVSGDVIGVAICGRVKDTSWSYTPGAKLWLSGTAGGLATSKPATATNLIQPVGKAIAATEVILNIVPSLAVVQTAGTSTVAFQ